MERCACDGCRKRISVMRFKCKFCLKDYCGRHQLPEVHACDLQHSEAFRESCAASSLAFLKAVEPVELTGRLTRL